jgi:hypothetical protein
MKRSLTGTARTWNGFAVLLALGVLLGAAATTWAQGVTTSSVAGIVKDAQGLAVPGATITAVHEPSGTTYEGFSQADGHFSMQGMRVGGPYTVTAKLEGFQPQTVKDIFLSLGVASDVALTLGTVAIAESVTVTASYDYTFSSTRTGAATAVNRAALDVLPTVTGRIGDITRLTPQASGQNFAGQDNRMNNITVDGSYFNNSFGLQGQPGDRTGVAPISLESIEQIQVNVAPFDVRQGNFVGAGVNTVTRSGTNKLVGSFYHRWRNEDYVGTEAKGLPVNPGTFTFRNTGGWAAGPVVKNKLFAFGNFEDELDKRPITTFRANAGGEPVGGSVTRVLASDLNRISSLLSSQFKYDTGPYEGISDETPVKRFLTRADYNLSNSHKVSFRFNYLDSITDVIMSGSSSLGLGRASGSATTFLSFQNSNYQIMENIRSGIGEWNWVVGSNMANTLITGYTTQDESRKSRGELFPFVDVLDGAGTAYTSFGFEPFTPNNELRYQTFQLQDNFSWFRSKHTLTFGATIEKYHSENVFFPGKQSVYVYNTLADFFTDVADLAANPNRVVSPVQLRRFQVRYMNIPNMEKPVQPLDVWYTGAYVQDEWRPKSNLTVTAGLRFDVPVFGDTAYENPAVNALTFRDETGAAVQYDTGKLPDARLLWSPRVGFNYDLSGNRTSQLRGGTGIFTGRPAYVWISNQIGNTGMLTGFEQTDNTLLRPFSPNTDKYKPASVTGAPAASVDLAVTDPTFKFPQVWRTNIAFDQRVMWGMTGTVEFIYNKDVNGVYYINANLPAAQSAYAGPDNRPRWVGASCTVPSATGCVTRINNAPGNQITNAIVLKNQNVGSSWNFAASLSKELTHGFSFKGAYSYGESKNTIDAGSIAAGSWTGNPQRGDPNNPGLGFSGATAGHRAYFLVNYSKQYFNFGATSVSLFWETRTIGNTSYTFAGDMNGDTASGNDLIYVPRDQSEMNFSTFTVGTRTYTAAEQAAAFDAYIAQDKYLKGRRGQYAERGAVFLPLVTRADLSITQDLFTKIKGTRQGLQLRIDITNVGNLLNHDWGVSQRIIRNQILTNGAADANGRATYRMVLVNGEFPTKSFETTTFTSDVYQFLISLRYSFN